MWSGRKFVGEAMEVEMPRLSKGLLEQFGVDLDQTALKRLGYKAEKRPNNPNTYYRVPGVAHAIENCPKAIKHIKKVVATGDQAQIALLFGKGVVLKVPSQPASSMKRATKAAGGIAGRQEEQQGSQEEEEEEQEEDEEEPESQVDAKPAKAVTPAGGKVGSKPPAGYRFLPAEKTHKVLDGIAAYISAVTPLKGVTGRTLSGKGITAVEETRPLGPGERMRHAFVWWDGKMEEPLRCAQYIFAAKAFLEIEAVSEALGLQEPQAKTVATNKKRSAADAAPAAPNSAPPAAKRTRGSLPEAAAAAAGSKTPGPGVASGTGNNAVGERGGRAGPAQRAAAGASAGHGARASHIPVSPSEGAAGNPASTSTGSGKTRGPLGRFLPRVEGATTSGAGAARSGAAAGSGHAAVKQGAGNQQVLDNVDDAVKLLGEALALGNQLPPSVLNSLPTVFTASLDGTLQEFLSAATAMFEGLKADIELLLNMAADYTAELTAAAAAPGRHTGGRATKASAAASAESHYRRPYLAFRAALAMCAEEAHNWLQDKQQREMIARLEGLVQIKKQLEDKRTEEEEFRQQQEQMRLQKERLEQELREYKQRIERMEEEAKRKAAALGSAAPPANQAA